MGKLSQAAMLCIAITASLFAWPGAMAPLNAQPPETGAAVSGGDSGRGAEVSGESVPGAAAVPSTELSEAERIASLSQSIENAEERLGRLQAVVEKQEQEFETANKSFRELDEQYQQQVDQRQKAIDQGDEPSAETEAELADLQRKRRLAQERLELAVQTRRNLQEQQRVIEQKLAQDRIAYERLTEAEDDDAPVVPGLPAMGIDGSRGSAEPSGTDGQPPPTPAPGEAPAQPAPEPVVPIIPGLPAPAPSSAPPPAAAPAEVEPPSKEVVKAQKEATVAERAAMRAEADLASVQQRLETLEEEIALKQQALQAVRQQMQNAEETRAALNDELEAKTSEGAAEETLQELRDQINATDERFDAATRGLRQLSRLLDEAQSQRAELMAEQIATLHAAEKKRQEAQAKTDEVARLQNPFSPHNILNWFYIRGPRILAIILGVLVLHFILQLLRPRLVHFSFRRSRRGEKKDRKGRAQTIVDAFYTTATAALYVIGLIMVLEVAGIPVAPLLGGAAVIGLAIAFAAQNLIKDYFNGFMILIEDQYAVGDVVELAGVSGAVERINLRITVLRDLEGKLHFVPHGNVTTVSNLTHGWSRVVFDIGVAYKEDPQQVMEVIVEIGREMQLDPVYGDMILEDLEMLGVDKFDQSAIIIKFLVKTGPSQQWMVKREMLRRIERRFDELGIEIPFPHRTIFHRYGPNTEPSPHPDFDRIGHTER